MTEHTLTYQVFDEGYPEEEKGYDIYMDGSTQAWITQRGQFSKILRPNGTYAENAEAQIEEIEKGWESTNPYGIPDTLLAQIQDDTANEIAAAVATNEEVTTSE